MHQIPVQYRSRQYKILTARERAYVITRAADIHIMTLCAWSVFVILTFWTTLSMRITLKCCTHVLFCARQGTTRTFMTNPWLVDRQKTA
eukprot:6210187-Pleurochrysis_carterae.AAC.1